MHTAADSICVTELRVDMHTAADSICVTNRFDKSIGIQTYVLDPHMILDQSRMRYVRESRMSHVRGI